MLKKCIFFEPVVACNDIVSDNVIYIVLFLITCTELTGTGRTFLTPFMLQGSWSKCSDYFGCAFYFYDREQ